MLEQQPLVCCEPQVDEVGPIEAAAGLMLSDAGLQALHLYSDSTQLFQQVSSRRISHSLCFGLALDDHGGEGMGVDTKTENRTAP